MTECQLDPSYLTKALDDSYMGRLGQPNRAIGIHVLWAYQKDPRFTETVRSSHIPTRIPCASDIPRMQFLLWCYIQVPQKAITYRTKKYRRVFKYLQRWRQPRGTERLRQMIIEVVNDSELSFQLDGEWFKAGDLKDARQGAASRCE